MCLFPMVVKLIHRKCVVVGAGKIAAAKTAGLLRCRAQVVVIAPVATERIQNQARAGKLSWHRREFRPRDVVGAFLVIAATNSSATNESVFRACQTFGGLCNVVDDPEHCDFYYPAVVRRGPLQIAISTGGRSPALARQLRIQLERQFGPEYSGWVEQVGKMRQKLRSRNLPAPERRKLLNQIASRDSLERFAQQRAAAKMRRAKKKRRQ